MAEISVHTLDSLDAVTRQKRSTILQTERWITIL